MKQNFCGDQGCKTNAYYTSTFWPPYGQAGSTQGQNQLFIGHCSFCAESQSHCGDASLFSSSSNFLLPLPSFNLASPWLSCTQINRVYLRLFFLSSFLFQTQRDCVFYVNRPPDFFFFFPSCCQTSKYDTSRQRETERGGWSE